jgi:hypothetical protein
MESYGKLGSFEGYGPSLSFGHQLGEDEEEFDEYFSGFGEEDFDQLLATIDSTGLSGFDGENDEDFEDYFSGLGDLDGMTSITANSGILDPSLVGRFPWLEGSYVDDRYIIEYSKQDDDDLPLFNICVLTRDSDSNPMAGHCQDGTDVKLLNPVGQIYSPGRGAIDEKQRREAAGIGVADVVGGIATFATALKNPLKRFASLWGAQRTAAAQAKYGQPTPQRPAGPPGGYQPRPQASGGNTGLIIGIAVAVIAVLGMMMFVMNKNKGGR